MIQRAGAGGMQERSGDTPEICVFAPWPIVSVTIERGPQGEDDIYFNAAGQGFWIARMALELGARTTLCGPFGGHTGLLCRALIEDEGVALRPVPMANANGSYVNDRREGERRHIAQQPSPTLSRHEVDDLYDAALAEALRAGTLILSGQYEEQNLPAERISALARDLHANGVNVIADVSGPTLRALDGGISILKVSHEELMAMQLARDDSREALVGAVRRLADGVAEDVVVSWAERGAIGWIGGALYEVEAPRLEAIDKSGAGDSMTAALGVARACGLDAPETLRLAAAVGALNVTRRGRGTGARADAEELAKLIEVRRCEEPA
jgi:1-phosphofructokinase